MNGPLVELRTIQVFLVLTEELHFARTADRTGLTASRVSQVVRQLEGKVGGPLFARTSRRVALLPLGEQLRDALAPSYAAIEDALTAARERAAGVAGTLLVGSYHLANYGVNFLDLIRDFEFNHPMASVRTVDLGMTRNPLTALRTGEVDVLVTRLPVSDPDLVIGPILSCERRVLALARDHRLARRRSVTYEDLAEETVNDPPGMPRELIDAFIPPTTPSGRRLRRTHISTFFDVVALVAAGETVHPTVEGFASYLGHPNVTTVPIADLPESETALVWRGTDSDKPLIRALAAAAALHAPTTSAESR